MTSHDCHECFKCTADVSTWTFVVSFSVTRCEIGHLCTQERARTESKISSSVCIINITVPQRNVLCANKLCCSLGEILRAPVCLTPNAAQFVSSFTVHAVAASNQTRIINRKRGHQQPVRLFSKVPIALHLGVHRHNH